jgi:predicted DsbA family dithiol-disulfide isomerase
MESPKTLRIDVWSDIACPWCYVGKKHLEQALAQFPHKDDVEVTFRSFELDPTASRTPKDPTETHAGKLARKHGMPVAEAQARIDSLAALGKTKGIDFRFDEVQSTNTFDAHRLLQFAGAHGKRLEMKDRLLRAYFSEGAALGDPEVLVALGAEVGLDAVKVREMLATGAHTEDVRGDEAQAREYGISGVPFFVLGRTGVSGAQPAEVLLKALQAAWAECAAGPDRRAGSHPPDEACVRSTRRARSAGPSPRWRGGPR